MEENKFFIKSMGCKSNQFEGSLIAQNLIENGFIQVSSQSESNYFILNSCAVTHKSTNETLYLLRNSSNKYPKIKNILTGCVPHSEKDTFLKYPYIHYVFGNDDKFKIGEYLKQDIKSRITNIMKVDKFNYQILSDTTKTRFNLKIQDGCNNRCAYCVIPFTRGPSRSATSEFIIDQINSATKKGFKEVVLTGIHIGQWGIDLDKTFIDLIRDIEANTDIPHYRLGSLNPTEITPELLDLLSNSKKFCPHFHLSLQSACNKTLKNMNRHYTVEKYLEQIKNINSLFANPFIGCDIIAGFPDETEEDFQTTINNLKLSGLSKIHTFPYSIRKGTIAENMKNHLSDTEKQKRADIIKEISKQKFIEFAQKNIDTVHTILIEKHPDKKTGQLKGITTNYLNVVIENTPENQDEYYNTLAKVHLSKFKDELFYGELV